MYFSFDHAVAKIFVTQHSPNTLCETNSNVIFKFQPANDKLEVVVLFIVTAK